MFETMAMEIEQLLARVSTMIRGLFCWGAAAGPDCHQQSGHRTFEPQPSSSSTFDMIIRLLDGDVLQNSLFSACSKLLLRAWSAG